MKSRIAIVAGCCLVSAICAAGPVAPAKSLKPEQIILKVLESDPWGMSGAEVSARAILKDKHGGTSELAFTARSRMHAPPLAKSLVRFSAPADLAGAGFLQIQQQGGDDERYLFMPELKKVRRISGNVRSSSFMGTDFSFADLDRRDLRTGTATAKPDQIFEKIPCYRVDVKPKAGSQYSRIELWVRKDNFLPIKMQVFDKAGVHMKTLLAKEARRISGRWFISKSTMTNHQQKHVTQLVLDTVVPKTDIPDAEFSVKSLEKI